MQIKPYLKRLGITGIQAPDLDTLQRLHRAHLHAVPFENLSIHLGQPIRLETDLLFDKIVQRHRGGFCYELNGLFCELLRTLGFEVSMLSARVRSGATGKFGPEFDHMVLKVELEESWLVDVGFGRAFLEPLALRPDEEQDQGPEKFKITTAPSGYTYWRWEDAWLPEYTFTLAPHTMDEFQDMCRYHQTSPQSPFTRSWMISMLTKNGRETVHEAGHEFRYITTNAGGRHEMIIHGFENAKILLAEIFGIPEDIFQSGSRRKRKK